MIQNTSKNGFKSILGELNKKQQAVYDCIKEHGELCNLDIAALTGMAINTVTPRTGELRDMHLVVERGERKSRTGRKAMFWGINSLAPSKVEFKPLRERIKPVEDDLFGHAKIDRCIQ